MRTTILLLIFLLSLLPAGPVWAHDPGLQPANLLDAIGFDQRFDAQVPLDLQFHDETGRTVPLQEVFGGKPVILSLGYFECPNLCPLERSGLLESLQQVNLNVGKDFTVLMVSINPDETQQGATKLKQQFVTTYNRPGTETGWRFLMGDHASIDRLADAVGFRYAYDAKQQQFAHASGLVVLTPAGKIARYLFGIEYAPRDLRLALVETAQSKIGAPLDQVLLFCYHYDPITGQYDLLVMKVMRLAGLATVVIIGAFLAVMFRREHAHGGMAT